MIIRDRATRIADTIRRLETDVDCWVSTANPQTGAPYLIPLSHWWDGAAIWLATARVSVTGRNLETSGVVRLGLGTVRDVVLVEGDVETIAEIDIDSAIGDAFAAKCGFDPRLSEAEFRYFRVLPRRIQAWHEEPELSGRTIMRDGTWLRE